MKTLDLLDEAGATATFFAVGWLADEMPELFRLLVDRGHEVATKGYYHRSLLQFNGEEFRDDLIRSREAIEKATGRRLAGYRVAHGWFQERDLWALEVLKEQGFDYDSSVRPLFRRFAGQTSSRFPHQRSTRAGDLWEFPLSSFHVSGWSLPVSGGNYQRQLPEFLMKWAVKRWHRIYDAPYLMYFHVWDLDPEQPRITAAPLRERVRQYRNLEKMEGRIRDYLKGYRFQSIAEYLDLDLDWEAPVGTAERSPERPEVCEVSANERVAISVVVPCYNEESVLGYLSNTLLSVRRRLQDRYELHFIFVDDGSTDRTWQELEETFGSSANCSLVRHDTNRGVAAAIMTGIKFSKTEIVASIDADCTYDPHQLDTLLGHMIEGVAMVTASPYHQAGNVVNVSSRRLFLSKTLSRMYAVILGKSLATYTSCFRIYRRSSVVGLKIRNSGFLGIAEVLGRLLLSGQTVVECPAVLESRLLGSSKMKIVATVIGHLGLLCQLLLVRLRGQSTAELMNSK